MYLSIYRLEEELNRPVRYIEVSQDLKISTGTVRTHIINLFAKKIPLQKHIFQGNKVQVSIEPEFKNLKLLENLLSLREKIMYSESKDTNLRRNFGF